MMRFKPLLTALSYVQGVSLGLLTYLACVVVAVVLTISAIFACIYCNIRNLFRTPDKKIAFSFKDIWDEVKPIFLNLFYLPVFWWSRSSYGEIEFPYKLLPRWALLTNHAPKVKPRGCYMAQGVRLGLGEQRVVLCRFHDDAIALKLTLGGTLHRLRWYHLQPTMGDVTVYLSRQQNNEPMLWLPPWLAKPLSRLKPARG